MASLVRSLLPAVLLMLCLSPARIRAQSGQASVNAAAAPVNAPVVVSAGGCPDAALLRRQLSPLLPGTDVLQQGATTVDARRAAVSDDGARYSVEVEGTTRLLEDAARDCLERARVAAVFIALNLRSAPAAAPPPAPASQSPAPQPEPAPAATAPLQLGVRVFGAGAYAGEVDRGAPGAGLGLWLGAGALRFGGEVGWWAETRLALGPGAGTRSEVALTRVPVTFTASYALQLGPLALVPLIGPSAELLLLRGVDLTEANSELRLNFGAVAGLELELSVGAGLFALLRATASAFPRAYALAVTPAGEVGQTPHLWLGAALGISWRSPLQLR